MGDYSLSMRSAFYKAHELSRIIARDLRLRPVLKCIVVPYCIECTEGRGTRMKSEEYC